MRDAFSLIARTRRVKLQFALLKSLTSRRLFAKRARRDARGYVEEKREGVSTDAVAIKRVLRLARRRDVFFRIAFGLRGKGCTLRCDD